MAKLLLDDDLWNLIEPILPSPSVGADDIPAASRSPIARH